MSAVVLAEKTMAAIESAAANSRGDHLRPHLGASIIGRPCDRELWYRFRWAVRPSYSPRLLRLFARGQREEPVVIEMLRGIGANVVSVDAETGRQFTFKRGHLGGSIDGAIKGVPDLPGKWHVLEIKTHSAKSFFALTKYGVREAHVAHYAQMQLYMHWSGMAWALYVGVCKDNDALHIERVQYVRADAKYYQSRGERIVAAQTPPPGVGDSPDCRDCRFCDARDLCYGSEVPAPSCRTCAHATVGEEDWYCEYAGRHTMIPLEVQKEGCPRHVYIPELLSRFAEPIDACPQEGWVEYRMLEGEGTFRNGTGGLSSAEICACKDKPALASAHVAKAREVFGATIIG
jgi:hypothetical protein